MCAIELCVVIMSERIRGERFFALGGSDFLCFSEKCKYLENGTLDRKNKRTSSPRPHIFFCVIDWYRCYVKIRLVEKSIFFSFFENISKTVHLIGKIMALRPPTPYILFCVIEWYNFHVKIRLVEKSYFFFG